MTVGLVVVGHSRALAHAAVGLAQQMIQGAGVPIAVAAGLDETTFGTDATAIADAIAAADQGQGVVVLMDLGSAVLSAELALDLIDDDVRDRVVLCPAPLVEGLVVAAVTAAGGADAHRVCEEACSALAAKIAQLRPQGPAAAAESHQGTEFGTGAFVLATPHGLHARPAARLVGEIARHDVRAELRNRTQDSAWVSADSLTSVMTLDGRHGDEMEIKVWGPGAAEVIRDVIALADRDFQG
jgi:phosphocarrier protein FPr